MANFITLSGYLNFPKAKENGGCSFSLGFRGGEEGKQWGNAYISCTKEMLKYNRLNLKKIKEMSDNKESMYATVTGVLDFTKSSDGKFTNLYLSASSIIFHDNSFVNFENSNGDSGNNRQNKQSNNNNRSSNNRRQYEDSYDEDDELPF